MEHAKHWLMDMEQDALFITKSEFVKKYGKENEKIWRLLHCRKFNNYFDFYNAGKKMEYEN